jgi:hypothetical protein
MHETVWLKYISYKFSFKKPGELLLTTKVLANIAFRKSVQPKTQEGCQVDILDFVFRIVTQERVAD